MRHNIARILSDTLATQIFDEREQCTGHASEQISFDFCSWLFGVLYNQLRWTIARVLI
jgi:hypothetical protein